MYPLRAALTLLVVLCLTPVLPTSSATGPLDPVQEALCSISALLPCQDGAVDWWTETPGAGWGETPAVSALSADGETLFTAATIQGANDGGEGCLVYADDVATGLKEWATVIPQELGCGLVLDMVLDPASGDIVVAGLDWFVSDVAGVHRLDAETGATVWTRSMGQQWISALAIDPSEGILFGAGWEEFQFDEPQAFAIPFELATGQPGSAMPAVPPGSSALFVLDIVRDAAADRILLSGAAYDGADYVATIHAMDAAGDALWTAQDPTPGFGSRMAYGADQDRVFMATQNGLMTVEATTGHVLGVAPMLNGETWDDIVVFYGIAYDPTHDIAVMTGSRTAPAGYAMVAARGSDGALLWDSSLAATEEYAIAAPPTFDTDGTIWFSGTVADPIGFRAIVGSVDPTTGLVTRSLDLRREPTQETATQFVGLAAPHQPIVAGATFLEGTSTAFEARITFEW